VYHLSTEELGEALNHQYAIFVNNDHDQDNILPPRSDIQRRGQHLLGELVWFNVVFIAGSGIVGYFFARRTLKPIELAHQAQARFTSEASHELRTPLAAMRADTEVTLMEKSLPVKTRRTLQGNLRDIERLEQLTGHLLDIAHYQNKTTTEPVLLDLDEIVRNVVERLSYAVQEKHISIKQNVRPTQVMGEQHSLEQLVTIVLDNAVKYSHKQGTVTISLQADGMIAVLTVKDEGIGIPADDLPHVLERFYRSANVKSNKKIASGYGLGLPLAHEIASALGGAVHIHSRENRGTTVRITLPLARI
jgi:signal transduction histidine kinase